MCATRWKCNLLDQGKHIYEVCIYVQDNLHILYVSTLTLTLASPSRCTVGPSFADISIIITYHTCLVGCLPSVHSSRFRNPRLLLHHCTHHCRWKYLPTVPPIVSLWQENNSPSSGSARRHRTVSKSPTKEDYYHHDLGTHARPEIEVDGSHRS